MGEPGAVGVVGSPSQAPQLPTSQLELSGMLSRPARNRSAFSGLRDTAVTAAPGTPWPMLDQSCHQVESSCQFQYIDPSAPATTMSIRPGRRTSVPTRDRGSALIPGIGYQSCQPSVASHTAE